MEITFDYSKNKAPKTGPVPAGRWDVAVKEINEQYARGTGDRYYQQVYEIIDGGATCDHANYEAHVGKRVWCRKGWLMGELLDAAGFGQGQGVVNADADQLIDYPVVIVITESKYTDKNTNEVKTGNEVLSIHSADTTPAPADPGADLDF